METDEKSDRHMRCARRTALALLTLTLLAAPLSAEAQQPGKVYRIGWLAPAPIPENMQAFHDGLRALGYIDGANLVIEQRYAAGKKPMASAAAEILASHPDVIVTDGSSATRALKPTAGSIPIVFVSGDPVGMGLVPSLSRPSGNLTGLALISTDLNVKRLGLLKEAFSRVSRFGVLYESRQASNMIPPIEAGARSLGLSLVRLEIHGVGDIEPTFGLAVREHVDALMPVSSALFDAEKQRLVNLAAKYRLPTIYEHRPFPEAGGFMSYGPDIGDVFRRVAAYVDKILKGATPADLPVEQPTKFELVINLKTAKARRSRRGRCPA
jgi:putative ABC transport system substrate-binding protein